MTSRVAVVLAALVTLSFAIVAAPAGAAGGGIAAPASATDTGGATLSGFSGAPTTATATATSSIPTASTDPSALVGLAGDELTSPPLNHRLSGNQALALANTPTKIKHLKASTRGVYPGVFMKGPREWQVSYYTGSTQRKNLKEVGQVTIDDPTATVLEAWTGFQVPWTMARGLKGAFGHKVNSVWIWIPLCILFVLPFITPRRPFRWLHLDLLVLVGFSASLAYFNHGIIGHSVPILFPLMGYLLARMLWIGLRRNDPDKEPLQLLVPASWLVVGIVFLIGFRIGLNIVDSNVIDVGDASSIGANLLVHGHRVYGNYPTNISQGDTYGPALYEAYVPFVKAFGFDEVQRTAAHAAAITFDLLVVALLWLLGRRMRGPTLGIALAYAWVTYPFTIFVTSTNSNDGLVAVMLVLVLLATSRPALRGVAGALAAFTKFAPLALAPVLATQERKLRPFLWFCVAFGATTVVVWIPLLIHGPSLHTIYNRTIGYQAGRGAPFSIWGYPGWPGTGLQHVWQGASVLLALGLAVVPRRRDVVGLAAVCASIILAIQMGATYWFYLYIVWFFPLVIVAILGRSSEPAPGFGFEPEPITESASFDPEPELVDV